MSVEAVAGQGGGHINKWKCNNNNPLFILGYTISIASLHHGPVPYTKIKRIYVQDKTNC